MIMPVRSLLRMASSEDFDNGGEPFARVVGVVARGDVERGADHADGSAALAQHRARW